MTRDGHAVTVLYGGQKDDKFSMEKDRRDEAIDQFRRGATRVLITTNVLARGIDIDQVNVVINYDLPLKWEQRGGGRPEVTGPDTETYVHRIGRTGRFGRRGVAINFVYDQRSRQMMKVRQRVGSHRPCTVFRMDAMFTRPLSLGFACPQDIETALNRKATWIKSSDPEQFEQMFEI
jgi:superfamily II DNA/RNA helicase